ncbi:MAG TPA: EboA domain-containing protein [Chitinophagaceae bacterium]|jgi:hypothetical protein|nr:EboA domain-containing protein [Chitinophagaceae bacterium]
MEETVYAYDHEAFLFQCCQLLAARMPAADWADLQQAAAPAGDLRRQNTLFATATRRVGRQPLELKPEELSRLQAVRPGFTPNGWTLDRLFRVWLLLQRDSKDKEAYIRGIEQLFHAAEMNESVALYSALPLLAYPEVWKHRCTEGIRSNIGTVLEAVICDNPYPSEQLAEGAWNQLVLKAFFTEKPVHRIVGLDRRANEQLARIVSDYAHERWAAGRPVPPLLWRNVGPFLNEQNFGDIQRVFSSENTIEREAAALACAASSYRPAQDLLRSDPELKTAITAGTLTWNTLAEKEARVY